jgi:type VI protein secretion system component VasF
MTNRLSHDDIIWLARTTKDAAENHQRCWQEAKAVHRKRLRRMDLWFMAQLSFFVALFAFFLVIIIGLASGW